MSFLGWMGFLGALLLLMALSSAYIRRLPVTTSAVYLLIGIAISPVWLNLVEINFIDQREWFEHLTEIAVIVSLFVGGLKLRSPFSDPGWRAALWLAGPVMVATIIGVAAVSHYLLGLPWPIGFLLGAVLAPTDPVLASTVAVNDAADKDRMRYGLSGEAGFNDGAAFPFVVFAVMWLQYDSLGNWVGEWALHRLFWAVPAGLLIGFTLGKSLGHLAIFLRSRHRETHAPNDLLALALIALAYVGAEYIGAWGFLSVFAAGLGFRQAEIVTVRKAGAETVEVKATSDDEGADHPPPAETTLGKFVEEEKLDDPAIASGLVVSEIISFGTTVERLLEVLLVIIVGICLALFWEPRALILAAALFFVIRPAAVMLLLIRTPTTRLQRMMMAWFGIRGIGSLYYLSYALNHYAGRAELGEAAALTISVVALSIIIHGFSSQPILDLYERKIASKRSIPDVDDN
ncbi:MAG: sodium:proton antiporter [Blastocatellia bacterium]|nr:sodium:proton antiporter [Blastocatellia bacterium]